MATFLTREGIVNHLHKIIDEADKELVLISPYIKADDETKSLLKNTRRGTPIHVIFGKSQSERNLGNVGTSFDMPGITISFIKDLHAKCYLNEKEALVTSMNLHEYSQEHNDEMGILVSKQDDAKLYEAIYQDAKRLLRAASGESLTSRVSKPKLNEAETPKQTKPDTGAFSGVLRWLDDVTRPQTTRDAKKKPSRGYCIRCKARVDADPERPYCTDCYRTWRRYSDPDYEDNYCHICKAEHDATMRKPLCGSCYSKYKNMFQFITD